MTIVSNNQILENTDEILERIRDAQKNLPQNHVGYMLQRYLEDSSTYVCSIYESSSVGGHAEDAGSRRDTNSSNSIMGGPGHATTSVSAVASTHQALGQHAGEAHMEPEQQAFLDWELPEAVHTEPTILVLERTVISSSRESADFATICWMCHTLKGHSDHVLAVVFSPDGKLVASASWDHTIKLWDSTTGAACCTLKGHSAAVRAVTFSPDGKLVSSGSSDHTVRLWDSATGAACRTLKDHSAAVRAVAFSPDGKLVASGSSDHTVMLWSAALGTALSVGM